MGELEGTYFYYTTTGRRRRLRKAAHIQSKQHIRMMSKIAPVEIPRKAGSLTPPLLVGVSLGVSVVVVGSGVVVGSVGAVGPGDIVGNPVGLLVGSFVGSPVIVPGGSVGGGGVGEMVGALV